MFKAIASFLVFLHLCISALAEPFPLPEDGNGRMTLADIAVHYLRPNVDYRHYSPHERYVSAAEEHRYPGLELLHNMHQQKYLSGGRNVEYITHQLLPSFNRRFSHSRYNFRRAGNYAREKAILSGLSNLRNLAPWDY